MTPYLLSPPEPFRNFFLTFHSDWTRKWDISPAAKHFNAQTSLGLYFNWTSLYLISHIEHPPMGVDWAGLEVPFVPTILYTKAIKYRFNWKKMWYLKQCWQWENDRCVIESVYAFFLMLGFTHRREYLRINGLQSFQSPTHLYQAAARGLEHPSRSVSVVTAGHQSNRL